MNFFSKTNTALISFASSLIFTEFYYFNWSSRLLISSKYLIFNTIYLFCFSYIFFFILFFLLEKLNRNYLSSFKLKHILIIYFSFIYFKILQIAFFYANAISLKSLLVLSLEYMLTSKLFFLIPFLKIIIPFTVIYCLLYFFLRKNVYEILKFTYSFSFIFFLLMSWDISKRIYHFENNQINQINSNSDRKVVWFVLDEYDPSYFINNKNKLKLNNIKNLTQNSLTHYGAYSPSNATLQSVTSTLLEIKNKGFIVEDHKLKIFNEDNEKINFEINNTLFQKLNDNHFSFQIISEALPYCTMLKIETNCIKNFNQTKFYFNAIKLAYFPVGYLYKVKKYFNRRAEFNINNLNTFNSYIDEDLLLSKKLNINVNDFKEILDKKNNLTFIHLFVPHTDIPTSDHIEKFFGMAANSDKQEYSLNLKYTDLLIKKILEIIEQSNNTEILLLLTSDHWKRSDSPNDAKPVLFIAKIKNQNQKEDVNKDHLNIFIPGLIIKYLNKEINTHKDIKIYLEKLPIFDKKETFIWYE